MRHYIDHSFSKTFHLRYYLIAGCILPSVFHLGHTAEQSAGGGPCPNSHSRNYCVGSNDAINGKTIHARIQPNPKV